MSERDMGLRKRRLYRFGYFDAAGELHETECYTDDQQALSALASVCDTRTAAGEPQISVIVVYRVENVAPVVILTDTSPT
jgi:hypothetical protein